MRISALFAALTMGSAGTLHAETEFIALTTPFLECRVSPESGTHEIRDKAGRVTWQSNPFQVRFGEIVYQADGKSRRASLTRCRVTRSRTGLDLRFPLPREESESALRVSIEAGSDGRSLEIASQAGEGVQVESLSLLDNALWTTGPEQGYVLLPVREGLLVRADSGKAFQHRFDTYAYEGCHLQMLGVVKHGAAALLTWTDPYVAADVRSVLTNAVWAPGGQVLAPSLVLRKTARSFRIQFLGQGDYVTLGKAYREVAIERGWLVPWDKKIRDHTERGKLLGAVNYKLWSVLDRQMNEASTQEERATVHWTFDEAAQVAEHLKHDLQLDKVLFTIGGWIHRGYDNQHPDILPAAPECGGDSGLAECARRVRELGYLFCLHDNYQDIYRDSPSWDESLIMKTSDGRLARGGHWAGGLAYLTCAPKAVELAKRRQNLPAVLELCHPNAYFIDTTYAAGLQECFDPNHPLTRDDDLRWKQALSDYARSVFGVFGSECGREWALPHSDFFEGLTGVSGRAYHDEGLLNKVGGTVVPLFEIVYRDSIAAYGKYGYDPAQAADYVLHHLTIGRPLHHHDVPGHLYWQRPASTQLGARGVFATADGGWAEGLHPFDRFVKNTAEILGPLHETTAQQPVTQHEFLTPDGSVQRTVFGSGEAVTLVVVNHSSIPFRYRDAPRAGQVLLPPYGFLVDGPEFLAFYALEFAGLPYQAPALFTVRSRDATSIASAARLRVYHGFGDPRLRWGQTVHTVAREAVLPNSVNGTAPSP